MHLSENLSYCMMHIFSQMFFSLVGSTAYDRIEEPRDFGLKKDIAHSVVIIKYENKQSQNEKYSTFSLY